MSQHPFVGRDSTFVTAMHYHAEAIATEKYEIHPDFYFCLAWDFMDEKRDFMGIDHILHLNI
jgi:hypothetical protein